VDLQIGSGCACYGAHFLIVMFVSVRNCVCLCVCVCACGVLFLN